MNKYLIPAVIALVVSILVVVTFSGGSDQSNIVGSVRTSADSFPQGFAVGNVPTLRNEIGGTIALGSSQASWKNQTGKTVYFDFADAATIATSSSVTGAVATSSYRVLMGTSTAATVSDFLTPSSINSSMLLWVLATSTISNSLTASTTNSVATGALKQVSVAANAFFNVSIINGATGAPATQCTQGGPCESATSTNRGFRLKWTARYHD